MTPSPAPAGTQTHTVYPTADNAGRFTGALTALDAPFEQTRQWQAYLTGLVAGLVRQRPVAEVAGTYTVAFHADDTAAGLLLARTPAAAPAQLLTSPSPIPAHTLGVLAIVDEGPELMSSAVLALRGGVSASGQLLADRVIAAGLNPDGVAWNGADLPAAARGQLAALGRGLLAVLDRHLDIVRGRG